MNVEGILLMLIGFGVWTYLIVLAARATKALEEISRGMAQLNRTNERLEAALAAAGNKA